MTEVDPEFSLEGGGTASPGGAVLAIEGVSNLFRGCRHCRKGVSFSC